MGKHAMNGNVYQFLIAICLSLPEDGGILKGIPSSDLSSWWLRPSDCEAKSAQGVEEGTPPASRNVMALMAPKSMRDSDWVMNMMFLEHDTGIENHESSPESSDENQWDSMRDSNWVMNMTARFCSLGFAAVQATEQATELKGWVKLSLHYSQAHSKRS